MKNLIFTHEELSEMEALEIKGGIAEPSAAVQNGCENSAVGCGSGVTQNGCINKAEGCGGTQPPPSTQADCKS